MNTYPNLKSDVPTLKSEAELIKITTKDDEVKTLKYKTERYDYENILKSLKIDGDYYKKKYKSINKIQIYNAVLGILEGASGVIVGAALSVTGVGAVIGVPVVTATTFIASIATLITNEYLSKKKLRYTRLRNHIKFITLLYEKTLLKSMIDKKIDEKEGEELKKIYNHYLDKRKDIMNSTKFTVEEVFGEMRIPDFIKNSDVLEKLNTFLTKQM